MSLSLSAIVELALLLALLAVPLSRARGLTESQDINRTDRSALNLAISMGRALIADTLQIPS